MFQTLTALASTRPLINVDGTLVLNIVLWILLFGILRGLLWEPMIRLFAARERGTEGSRADARELDKEARTRREQYEHEHRKARSDAAGERDRLRGEGLKLETEILSAARATINAKLEAQRAELRTQRDAMRTEIRATIPALAGDIATRVLGREVPS